MYELFCNLFMQSVNYLIFPFAHNIIFFLFLQEFFEPYQNLALFKFFYVDVDSFISVERYPQQILVLYIIT